MEYARMASQLLIRFRRDMNGAVVADMENRGLHYPRNYGVSQHTIRNAAKQLPTDHDFAKHLWQQPVRELKIAAVTIADAHLVTEKGIDFWMDGVTNSELAENLASFLLSRTTHVNHILTEYSPSANSNHVYTALLTAARGYPQGLDAASIIEITSRITAHTPQTERAVALLLSRIGNENEQNHKQIANYADTLRTSVNESFRRIADEIMI